MEDQETEGGGEKSTGGGQQAPPPSATEKDSSSSSSSASTQALPIRIKEEPKDDIKDFAETTMNELLGWYGYTDKVDHQDTAQLSLNNFRPPSTSPRHHSGDDISDAENAIADEHGDPDCGEERGEEEGEGRSSDSGDSGRASRDGEETGRLSAGSSETALAAQHRSLVTALSKSRAGKGGSDEASASYIVCAWCQKPGMKLFTLRTPTGSKAFCSEVCFTQCRRASFKKNKVCDWCKHVRHTVNFVDFQDGEMQLQFCSEKCLNQYKMNIFCTETQEHLKQIQSQLNEERKNAALSPGGASSSSVSSRGVSEAASASSAARKSDEQILITPELWLSKRKADKLLPKAEILEESDAEREGKKEIEKVEEDVDDKEKERRRESSSAERSRSRELLDRKRTPLPPLSTAAAAAAAAFAASYTGGLHAGKSSTSRLSPGADRAPERSPRDKERLRRLIRDSGREREPRPRPSGSPASSPQFSPPSRPRVSSDSTPPVVPPMLLPHLNGLSAGLAGLGMFNPLLCSSLFGAGAADREQEAHHQPRPQPAHSDRERKSSGRSSERAPSASTPGAAHSGSPANTGSTSGTPNPPAPPQHPPPPGSFPPGVPGLSGLQGAGIPQGLHPPPFMLGVPPFGCPPGLFPADPALMGGLLALQGCPPGQAPRLPNGQLAPGEQQQQPRDRHGHRQQGSSAASAPPPPPPPPISATAGCLSGGVPPVTVMVPFPVVLPIPVPIPIPLPIAPEKIQQFFKEREQALSSPSAAAPRKSSSSVDRHSLASPSPARDSISSHRSDRSPTPHHYPLHNHNRHLHPHHNHAHPNPHPHHYDRQTDSVSSDSSCHSPGLSIITGARSTTPGECPASAPGMGNGCISCASCRPFPRPGRESADSIMALRKSRESAADSIMTLRRESVRSLMAADAVSPSLAALSPAKRSLTPVFPVTLDLSKRPRLDENRNNDEEAIDLSKDSRSSSPTRSLKDLAVAGGAKHSHPPLLSNGSSSSSTGSAASGKENQNSDPDMASIDGDSEAGPKVPKIHIIDSRDDPPLAQPLPLPPADHPYSMRRSLILDAPSVPRPPRSPSPERRYVRTVPRDMVEAAKRRCLRARVRTK